MTGRARIVLAVAAIAAATLATQNAPAAEPCPAVVCVEIAGKVLDPHGNGVPSYTVVAQRADGYNETTTTDDAGTFRFALPPATPNACYQVVGRSDPFYTVSNEPKKACTSSTVTLRPKYRINGVSGQQKTYLGDTSKHVFVPVEVSALSRSFPAPFHDDPLPFVFEHRDPHGHGEEGEQEQGHVHHGATGVFHAPSVRSIAPGVWQYVWRETIHLPSHQAGYYDMDWGRGTSVYSPMMDCRMIWFGFGAASVTPAKTLPGTVATIAGQRLGAEKGTVVIKGGGQVSVVEGSQILEWTDSTVKFLVPPTAKSGWVAAVTPAGVATNGQPLTIGA